MTITLQTTKHNKTLKTENFFLKYTSKYLLTLEESQKKISYILILDPEKLKKVPWQK